MVRDLTSLIGVPRNGTGWHETNCTEFSLTKEEIIYITDTNNWVFDVNYVKGRWALILQYNIHTHVIRVSALTTRMSVPGLPELTVTSSLVNSCIWLEKLLLNTRSQALVTEFCPEAFQYNIVNITPYFLKTCFNFVPPTTLCSPKLSLLFRYSFVCCYTVHEPSYAISLLYVILKENSFGSSNLFQKPF